MTEYAHGYVQVARGMLIDRDDPADVDAQLARAIERVKDLEGQRDRYKAALEGVVDFLRWTLAEDAPEGGWEFAPWSPAELNPRLRAALAVLNQKEKP